MRTLTRISISLLAVLPLIAGGFFFGSNYTASTAYVGPGDITSGAVAWYGLRAYSLATRGTKAVNVCIPADAACADLSTDATTGALVITTIGGSSCASVTCTVKLLYDQTTGSNCSGICDAGQNTIALRPVFTTSCIGSLPCMTWTASSTVFSSSGAATISQPFSMSAVGKRTANFTSYGSLGGIFTGGVQLVFNNSADTALVYGGTLGTPVAATDNVVHALNGMLNGASSKLQVDSTLGTLSAGTTGIADTLCIGACNNALTGISTEFGFWSGDQSANFTAMSNNQHTYWGF